MNRSPLEWIRCLGLSAHQTSVSQRNDGELLAHLGAGREAGHEDQVGLSVREQARGVRRTASHNDARCARSLRLVLNRVRRGECFDDLRAVP